MNAQCPICDRYYENLFFHVVSAHQATQRDRAILRFRRTSSSYDSFVRSMRTDPALLALRSSPETTSRQSGGIALSYECGFCKADYFRAECLLDIHVVLQHQPTHWYNGQTDANGTYCGICGKRQASMRELYHHVVRYHGSLGLDRLDRMFEASRNRLESRESTLWNAASYEGVVREKRPVISVRRCAGATGEPRRLFGRLRRKKRIFGGKAAAQPRYCPWVDVERNLQYGFRVMGYGFAGLGKRRR